MFKIHLMSFVPHSCNVDNASYSPKTGLLYILIMTFIHLYNYLLTLSSYFGDDINTINRNLFGDDINTIKINVLFRFNRQFANYYYVLLSVFILVNATQHKITIRSKIKENKS